MKLTTTTMIKFNTTFAWMPTLKPSQMIVFWLNLTWKKFQPLTLELLRKNSRGSFGQPLLQQLECKTMGDGVNCATLEWSARPETWGTICSSGHWFAASTPEWPNLYSCIYLVSKGSPVQWMWCAVGQWIILMDALLLSPHMPCSTSQVQPYFKAGQGGTNWRKSSQWQELVAPPNRWSHSLRQKNCGPAGLTSWTTDSWTIC